MRNHGFSVTRLMIVVVLLGALIGVSKIVTPPPPGPPEPPKTEAVGATKVASKPPGMEQREAMMQREKAMKAQMKAGAKRKPSKPHIDPSSIDVTPTYFSTHQMGEAGLKQTAEEVAKAKAIMAEEQAEAKKNPPHAPPAGMPPSVPGSPSPVPADK